MKLDKTQPLYILYGCNIVKERSTMRLVAATTDEEMLKVIIGSQILLGVMDYRGFSNMKGFQQFRAACHSDRAHDALSHAAAEFMGELASASLWIGDRNAVQQAQDFLIHCLFRGSLSVADCLSDL